MKTKLSLLFALALTLLILFVPASTFAATNDNFVDTTVVASLPFSDTVDNSTATNEPGEPTYCNFLSGTVWYSFTPASNTTIRIDTNGGMYYSGANIYQVVAPGLGGLSGIGCTSFGSYATFAVQAGTTYYVQAGGMYGSSGSLRVNIQEIVPPANDAFANATSIPSLPFAQLLDLTAATKEPGEPSPSCANGSMVNTAWYMYTTPQALSVSASPSAGFTWIMAVYSGTSLSNLHEVGCRIYGGVLTFRAEPGVTYFIQEGGFGTASGSMNLVLDVAPPPNVNFYFNPGDPSVFDTVQFYDQSYDPAGVGIVTEAWNFGDGSTASGCCPTHRYANDGDYNAKLTVTTGDGRTAAATRTLHVSTHDVAITKFSAPQSASVGQTRALSVGINSKRQAETVTVQLLKSTTSGYVVVGTLTQYVPPRSANRTTDFNFSYTFAPDDASVGKVTFKAVATLVGARDALPADNEAIAPPTKVTK